MKILIIEDERHLAAIVRKGLEENGFVVDEAHDGEEGSYMAETQPYDAVILDIGLPLMDGFEVIRRLRRQGWKTPVIMLTARHEVQDRVKGLDSGADDYLAKPFDFSELLSRLKALIRRDKGQPSPVITLADLSIDSHLRRVERNGEPVPLTAREFNIFYYLLMNRGRVIGKSELIDHVYDMNDEVNDNLIEVYINYIRNKIDRGRPEKTIRTVRGVGYLIP